MAEMTPDQFANCVQMLIKAGRERNLSDDAMLAQLEDIAEALREGLS